MKKAASIILSTCATVILAAAVFASPAATNDAAGHSNPAISQDASQSQTQSVSGTIASVDKTSFTLNVTSSQSPKGHAFVQDAAPKTMTFQIDKNTTVDGTLKVSANADVTYRQDTSGNNIAINVHVTPAS